MSLPHWTRYNLIEHYQKHPAGEDKDCWCDLIQDYPGPISQDDYEQYSLEVISKPWLVFQAGRKDGDQDPCEQVKYYVDDSLCLTAVNVKSSRIKTCFHVHIKMGHHEMLSGDSAKLAFLKNGSTRYPTPRCWLKTVLKPQSIS